MFLVVSYFMTVDIHRFALMWLVHSRNRFFRVGPNISEKFAPGRGGGEPSFSREISEKSENEANRAFHVTSSP